jgi:DNA-directed RNA polymerase subunit K/omega
MLSRKRPPKPILPSSKFELCNYLIQRTEQLKQGHLPFIPLYSNTTQCYDEHNIALMELRLNKHQALVERDKEVGDLIRCANLF